MTGLHGQNDFSLLKRKTIYAILDGDTAFMLGNGVEVAMPYQSGPRLVDILNHFGCVSEYSGISRWMYMERLLDYCINKDRVSDMLSYFFSLERFSGDLKGLDVEEINARHQAIVQGAIGRINGELFFSGHELRTVGGKYVMAEIGVEPVIAAPAIKVVDRVYIKEIAARAHQDIADGNLDSALTKARTLLEEVFCYVIEHKGVEPNDSGNINKLYTQVKDLYNMHADSSMDNRIKTLLSGLEKIVSAVSEMRNKDSDAHGVGQKRLTIADYHARLMVNAATNMADFVLSVAEHANRAASPV